MTSYIERVKIKTATEGTHKRVMKSTHDTSTDFGQFMVLNAKILEIGKGTIIPWTYSNMQPMPQPTWGEVIYENRIFLVPLRQIFKAYEDFREDVIHVTADESSQSTPTLPYTYNDDIVDSVTAAMTTGTSADYNWKVIDNGTTKYYKHSEESLWRVKFYESLGYKFIFTIHTSGVSMWKNVLRILAVAKVYIDWYFNIAYKGNAQYTTVKQLLERDNGNLYYSKNDLIAIITLCKKAFYDTDYFTGCWDQPNHPNLSQQESTYNLFDPNTDTNGVQNKVINQSTGGIKTDPYIVGQASGSTTAPRPTQWAIDMLRSLTNFLKRNQLAGAETLQRFLARYGIENTDLKMKRSRMVGTVTWRMQVNPVFSQADTAASGGEVLGSYAAKGEAISGKLGQHSFEVEIGEDCMMVETLVIKPVELYTQGEDRDNIVLSKTEMLTPEFDNVGVEPVFAGELIHPEEGGQTTDTTNLYTQIFGFLPRYAYWKTMKDRRSGNFTNPKFAAMFDPYTLTRKISPNISLTNYVHSFNFTQMVDAEQYDRIFYGKPTALDKEPWDNFNIHHELIVEWYSYAKPLYDYYDWEHEGGKEIEIKNQGSLAKV